jgi:3-hydroxyacyl-[acyl-carrier protein] dehydratase / trans-2-decenoyl-[acyl-carrier protein] isomerase
MSKQQVFSEEDLIQHGREAMFGEGNARLPIDQMRMMDRITNMAEDGGKYGRGEVIAELDIDPDQWFFKCHFVEDPVMPGCLGLDALWQLLGFFLAWSGGKGRGRALGCGEVKFTGQVLPSAGMVRYQLDIKRVINGTLTLGIADGVVMVQDRVIYTAKNLRVGLFTSTDAL